MPLNIKPTKIDKDRRLQFDEVKRAREIAQEIFGWAPSYKTVIDFHERVFLLGFVEDEEAKPGKLTPTQQNIVEDIAACRDEVMNVFGDVPAVDRADAAMALFDDSYKIDYLDDEDEDDLDEDAENDE